MLGRVHAPCWKACLFSMDLTKHSCGNSDLFCLREEVRKCYISSESEGFYLSVPALYPQSSSGSPAWLFWSLWPLITYFSELIFCSAAQAAESPSESLWDLPEFAIFCLSLVVIFSFPSSKLYCVPLHTELQHGEG